MNAALLIFLAVVAGAALVVLVAGVRVLLRRESVKDPSGLGSQLAGLIVGTVLAVGLWVVDRHLILVLAPAAGMCWLIGLIAAERTRKRRNAGSVRLAGLVPRTLGRYLSRWALGGMRAAFAATAGLAAAGIALASSRDSSMYTAACPDGTLAGHGPWPGAAYALPALAALVAGWALTEWTIRLIAARAPEPVSDVGDAGRRALAARTAVTAAGLMVAPTLAGLLVPMGASLHATCPSGARDALALVMLAAGAGLALISAAAWVAALLTVGRAVVPRVAEA